MQRDKINTSKRKGTGYKGSKRNQGLKPTQFPFKDPGRNQSDGRNSQPAVSETPTVAPLAPQGIAPSLSGAKTLIDGVFCAFILPNRGGYPCIVVYEHEPARGQARYATRLPIWAIEKNKQNDHPYQSAHPAMQELSRMHRLGFSPLLKRAGYFSEKKPFLTEELVNPVWAVISAIDRVPRQTREISEVTFEVVSRPLDLELLKSLDHLHMAVVPRVIEVILSMYPKFGAQLSEVASKASHIYEEHKQRFYTAHTASH